MQKLFPMSKPTGFDLPLVTGGPWLAVKQYVILQPGPHHTGSYWISSDCSFADRKGKPIPEQVSIPV